MFRFVYYFNNTIKNYDIKKTIVKIFKIYDKASFS